MKKNAVIFDLDGTMWNACEPVLISWNVVLRRHGLPAVKKETIESFMGKTLGQIVSLYFTDMTQEEGLNIANECVHEEANYLPRTARRSMTDLAIRSGSWRSITSYAL